MLQQRGQQWAAAAVTWARACYMMPLPMIARAHLRTTVYLSESDW